MDAAGAAVAFAALNLTVRKAMKVFRKSERTVYYWLSDGPPEHISYALQLMMVGELSEDAAADYVKSIRTRRKK